MTTNTDFSDCIIELVKVADAVVNRWHPTSWNDAPTVEYINRLNRAVLSMHYLAAKKAKERKSDNKQ